MPINMNTNLSSMNAAKSLGQAQSRLGNSFDRLSSGKRITSAKDDASGLAISEGMMEQIRALAVAERNANDGVSLAQTAEGGLSQMGDIMGRMRELAMSSSNGTLSDTDRAALQTEFSSLQQEIGRIQESTKFNGQALLDPGKPGSVELQVGPNSGSADKMSLALGGPNLSSVTGGSASILTAGGAQSFLATLDAAGKELSTSRGNFGSFMNRAEVSIQNAQTARLNLAAANSRIADVDIAEETATLSRTQVQSQMGSSILAQANVSTHGALSLLR